MTAGLDLNLALGLGLIVLAGFALAAAWLDRRINPPIVPGTTPGELQARAAGAPIGIVIADPSGRIRFANAPAARSLGLDEGEARNGAAVRSPGADDPQLRSWSEAWREDFAALKASDGGNPYRVVNAGADRAFSWWLCAFGDWVLVLVQDLAQASRGERVARAFLADLSHELRTPLTAILAHLELLKDPALPAPAHDTSLRLVHQEATRISRLVQDLLTLSRLEAVAEFDLRAVDVLVVAETAVADVILEAERRDIAIDLEARRPLPRALADPDRLRQVFVNLLDNAVKYCGPGDRVTVTLSPHNESLCVGVCDNGPGIAAEHLPHLTRRFYRAQTDGYGSGLGLAIVHEILTRHHTVLELTSPPAEGQHGLRAAFVLRVADGAATEVGHA